MVERPLCERVSLVGKIQAKVLFDYRRGTLPGVSSVLVPEGAASWSLNTRFRGGVLEAGTENPVVTPLSLSSTDSPTAIFFYTDYKQDVHGILTTHEKIFRKKNTDAWTQIGIWPTAFSPTNFPVVDGVGVTYVSGTTTKNSFILTDGVNSLQEVDLDAGTVAPLGGSPPICHTVTEFQSHLLLGYTDVGSTPESPFRMQWSDTGKYNVWTGGNSGFQDLVDEFGPVVGYERMGDRLYLYKLNCIYEVLYIGPPRMFDAHQVVSGRGAVSSRAIAHTGTAHCFIGGNGQVYEFNGREVKILSEQLDLGTPPTYAQILYNDTLQEVWILGLDPVGGYSSGLLGTQSFAPSADYNPLFNDGTSSNAEGGILRLHLPTNSWWSTKTWRSITCLASQSMQRAAYSTSGPAISWATSVDPRITAGVGSFNDSTYVNNLVKGVANIDHGGFHSAEVTAQWGPWSARYEFGALPLGISTRVIEILVQLEACIFNPSDLVLYLSNETTYTSYGSPTKIYAQGTLYPKGRWISWPINVTVTDVKLVLKWVSTLMGRSSIRKIVIRFIPRTRPFLDAGGIDVI